MGDLHPFGAAVFHIGTRRLNGKPRNACLLRGRTGAESMIALSRTSNQEMGRCEVPLTQHVSVYFIR